MAPAPLSCLPWLRPRSVDSARHRPLPRVYRLRVSRQAQARCRVIVLTENGDIYSLRAISHCVHHGQTAHTIGPEGSASCDVCGAEADARSMRREVKPV